MWGVGDEQAEEMRLGGQGPIAHGPLRTTPSFLPAPARSGTGSGGGGGGCCPRPLCLRSVAGGPGPGETVRSPGWIPVRRPWRSGVAAPGGNWEGSGLKAGYRVPHGTQAARHNQGPKVGPRAVRTELSGAGGTVHPTQPGALSPDKRWEPHGSAGRAQGTEPGCKSRGVASAPGPPLLGRK